MNRVARVVCAAAMLFGLAAPVTAQDATVAGIWAPDANSDYEATLCGADGNRFCLKVVDLRGKMRKPKNLEYLGKTIVQEAKPSGKNVWKGTLNLFGISGDATITLRSRDTLHLKACAYVVVCEEITLKRKS